MSKKEDKPKKQLRGFANPEFRKNINRQGAPRKAPQDRKQAKSKTAKDLDKLYMDNTPEAIAFMMKVMRSDKEKMGDRLKACGMVVKGSTDAMKNKLSTEQPKEKKQTETVTISEGNGTTGQVLSLTFDESDEE